MKQSRRHHFVSQCYLAGFTNDGTSDGQLFAIDALTGHSFNTKPLNVGVERDFNAIEGRPEGELEDKLAGLEGLVAPALARIISERSLDNFDDWWSILNLFAMFATRNPRTRQVMTNFMSEIMKMTMEVTLANPHRWASQVKKMNSKGLLNEEQQSVTYEVIKKFQQSDDYEIAFPRGYHIGLELDSIEPVLKTLTARNWMLLIADEKSGSFITTDHPVCLIHQNGEHPSFSKPLGHALEASTVLLPICKSLLAVGTYNGQSGSVNVSKVQVAHMNSLVAPSAERQIYAANDLFPFQLEGNLRATGKDLVAVMLAKAQDNKQRDSASPTN
jgi:Protein of unknown function (DUF4238)